MIGFKNYKWMSLRGTKQSVGLMERSLKAFASELKDCHASLSMTGIYSFGSTMIYTGIKVQ